MSFFEFALPPRGFGALLRSAQMIRHTLAIVLAFAVSSGCSTPRTDQEQVLAEARALRNIPVKRSALVSSLGLEDLKSERFGGSIRGGRMYFTEIWEHGSGLTIKAWDSEYVGAVPITPGSIDEILNAQGTKSSNFVGSPALSPARQTFEEFVVLGGGKVLYRSETQEGE